MWRISIVLLICLFAGSAYSNPPAPNTPNAEQKNQVDTKDKQQPTNPDQRGTETSPLFIKVIPPLAVEQDSTKEHENSRSYTSSEWWLVYITGALVLATVGLMVYTARLWGATKSLAEDAEKTADRQATEMETSLRIARESADAATKAAEATIVSSMPILSPLIVGGTLHPFKSDAEVLYASVEPKMFESSVHFVFENFGKTPGMIREVRADLFLCEMDQFPIVDFAQLPIIDYQPIIAGDSRGQNAVMGVAELAKTMTISQAEFTELLASADNRYRRFAFIGRVVYDDFFETRHTRKFCVKLRLMDRGLFQLVRGGKAYNHVERQEIPKDE